MQYQVAVAKHLGLQTLRLASSPLLPFNTTHYAFELESYLDRYGYIPCLLHLSSYLYLFLVSESKV